MNAAVVDTWDGVRAWHPEARTLRRHLEQTVNSRLWHECDRARRRHFVPVTAAAADDSLDEAGGVEIEMSRQREDPRTRPDALLDAFETGHHVEADAEANVGIAGQAFKNLARRFKTIRRHLPHELRSAALDVMIRDGGAPVAWHRTESKAMRADCQPEPQLGSVDPDKLRRQRRRRRRTKRSVATISRGTLSPHLGVVARLRAPSPAAPCLGPPRPPAPSRSATPIPGFTACGPRRDARSQCSIVAESHELVVSSLGLCNLIPRSAPKGTPRQRPEG